MKKNVSENQIEIQRSNQNIGVIMYAVLAIGLVVMMFGMAS